MLSIAGRMAAARDDLVAAVDELTLTSKRRAPSDTDPGRLALVDPLLVAVEESRGLRAVWLGHRSSVIGSEQPPAKLSAAMLLDEVDQAVGRAIGSRAGSRRTARVRTWCADQLSTFSHEALTEAARLAGHWVTACASFFEPPRWLGLRNAACPACGHRHARAEDGSGDAELSEALVADLTTGQVLCSIVGCGASWNPDHLELLAATLDVQTAVETLAVET